MTPFFDSLVQQLGIPDIFSLQMCGAGLSASSTVDAARGSLVSSGRGGVPGQMTCHMNTEFCSDRDFMSSQSRFLLFSVYFCPFIGPEVEQIKVITGADRPVYDRSNSTKEMLWLKSTS